MMDRSDPERRLSIEELVATAISQFERGAMTEDVFRASLFACYIRGSALEIEVRLHRPFRSLAEVSKPIIDGFVSGLS